MKTSVCVEVEALCGIPGILFQRGRHSASYALSVLQSMVKPIYIIKLFLVLNSGE